MSKHHNVLNIFTAITWQERLANALQLCVNLTFIAYFAALFFAFEYPEDTGLCDHQGTEQECLEIFTLFETEVGICEWTLSPYDRLSTICIFKVCVPPASTDPNNTRWSSNPLLSSPHPLSVYYRRNARLQH